MTRQGEFMVQCALWFLAFQVAAVGCDIRNAIHDNTAAVRAAAAEACQ